MSVIEADVESSSLSLRDVLAVATRRRLQMLLAFCAGLVLTVALATLLPARYQSTATILIEQQELPTEFVRSTVTSYADQRVQVISQRVMTTQTLLDIIRRYELYPRERARESREALIARMREDVAVKMISADVIDPRSGRPTAATIAFSVAFSNPSPEQAARVANELTTLFLNENLTNRTRVAEEATSFLQAEGDRVNKRIAELESQLAAFKTRNLDSLPELTGLNMQLLDRTQQSLEQTETRKSSLEQQSVYLEAQLAQLKPNSAMFSDSGERILSTTDRLKTLRSQLASARALYTAGHPDILRLEREIGGLESQDKDAVGVDLNDLRRSLDEAKTAAGAARERYAPDHPDRVRLERQVASLEEQLAAATRAAAKNSPGAPRPGSAGADNPAYIQLQAQLAATRNELAALTAEQGRLRAQAGEYQRKITVSPQIEKQYHELSRDYENNRAKYQELRSKLGEATLARNLETDRKGERFTLIEPPLVPQDPVSPNRLLILILGAVLSVGIAIGTAALLEALDGTVRGRRDLMEILQGAAPLAIIPSIGIVRGARSATTARLRRVGAPLAVALGLLAVAALAVHVLYRPLDVLWFVMLRKLGLG